MCDAPSIAVFCNESMECFPGIVSKFFYKLLATIPVARSLKKKLETIPGKHSIIVIIIIIIIIIIIDGIQHKI